MKKSVTPEEMAEMQKAVAADLKEGVKTWDDFYDKLRAKMQQYSECQCVFHTSDALYTNYAFVVAMRELPEEGDIYVIIDRMAVLLTVEASDKLFANLQQPDNSRPGAMIARAIAQGFLREVATGGGESGGEEDTHFSHVEGNKLH